MQEKEILTHLKNGLEEITPDCFEEIWEKSLQTEETPDFSFSRQRKSYAKRGARFAAIAACFLCFIGYQYYQVLAVYTTVNLDVNPSIQICANRKDEVLSVEALNEDAKEVVELLPQEKREKLDNYVDVMIQEMAGKGYLAESDSSILVSVENKNAEHAEELRMRISNQIEKTMVCQQVEGNVISQVMEKENPEVKKLSEDMNISKGKATFIHNIASQNKDLSEKKLAKMTITEIVVKAEKKEWKLEDGCRKKVGISTTDEPGDVSTGTNINKGTTETVKPTENVTVPEQSTEGKENNKTKDSTKKNTATEYKEEVQQYTKMPNTTYAPKESVVPVETSIPVATEKIKRTKTPTVTQEPENVWKPDETVDPVDTKNPKQTEQSEHTKEPKHTKGPEQTKEPKRTQEPEQTQEPVQTQEPNETQEPDKKGPYKTKGPKQFPFVTYPPFR